MGLALLAWVFCADANRHWESELPYVWDGLKINEGQIVPDDYLTLSNADVVIGKTTMREAADKFGETIIHSYSYQLNHICYKSNDDDTIVILISDSPDAPPTSNDWNEVITAIWIGHSRHVDADKDKCSVSNMVSQEITGMNGISLDTNFAKIKEALGEPTFHEEPFVAYKYRGAEFINSNIYDVLSGLEMEFNADRLEWFSIHFAVLYYQ